MANFKSCRMSECVDCYLPFAEAAIVTALNHPIFIPYDSDSTSDVGRASCLARMCCPTACSAYWSCSSTTGSIFSNSLSVDRDA